MGFPSVAVFELEAFLVHVMLCLLLIDGGRRKDRCLALSSSGQRCRQKSLRDSLWELPSQSQEYPSVNSKAGGPALGRSYVSFCLSREGRDLAARGPLRVEDLCPVCK